MHKPILAAALLLAPAAAGAMTVDTFLQKSEALQAKGAMALFSSDLGVLKREVRTAALSLRNERLAAEKAGQRPAYCPKGRKGSLDADQIVAIMKAVPASDRPRLQVKDALRAHYARTFPC